MDPNVLLTIGLLIFSGVQLWIMHQTEERAKKERALDARTLADQQLLEHDVAYQTVYAEHFRLWSLASQLEKASLAEMSVLGLLRPEHVEPRNPSNIAQKLASLSAEAGHLGVLAVSLASDTALAIASFNARLEKLMGELPGDFPERVAAVQKIHARYIEERQAIIRSGVREIANILWDALSHTEPAKRERVLNFSDTMLSQMGQNAARELADRAKRAEQRNIGPGAAD
jgi:hypothetical protein